MYSFPKILSWEYEKILDDGFTRRVRCVCLDGIGKIQCFVSDSYNFRPNFSKNYFEVGIDDPYMTILDCLQFALKRSGLSSEDLISYEEIN